MLGAVRVIVLFYLKAIRVCCLFLFKHFLSVNIWVKAIP